MEYRLIETIVLTGINAMGVFLIIVILANSFKEGMYRWFVGMTLALMGWVDFAYLGYFADDTNVASLAYRLNLVFVILFFYTSYIFYIEHFLKVRNSTFRVVLTIVSILLAVLSLFTNTIHNGVIVQDWGNEVKFGVLDPFFYIFAGVMTGVFLYYFVTKYTALQAEEKRKVLYFLIGTFFLIVFNIVFNILSPTLLNTAKFQHLGDYSAVAFLAFTAFAVIRRNFLNVKIALAAFLISGMSVLLLIDVIALSDNLPEQGIKVFIFVLFIGLSAVLVRSVLNEIRQREELAKVNKDLDKSRQKYFDLATEQKDIIDVMGHEIRTPLTAIIQAVRALEKYVLPKEEKIKKVAEKTKDKDLVDSLSLFFDAEKTTDKASAHAVALVTDMLETARLDKNRFELNYEEFDLLKTVEDNVELMSKTVDDASSSVSYKIEFDKPKVKELIVNADKTRIGQAVYALLNNAIKYRDPDKDNVKIHVSIEKKAKYVEIHIKDNGIGIASEDIAKLGKKFLRLNPKTNGGLKRPGGTGLGLFVVKGIMLHHHGELLIQSEGLTKGSTFTLKFPLEKQDKK